MELAEAYGGCITAGSLLPNSTPRPLLHADLHLDPNLQHHRKRGATSERASDLCQLHLDMRE